MGHLWVMASHRSLGYDRGMGPGIYTGSGLVPHPELAALRMIDAYSKTFGLTIKASRGAWTVEDGDADPVELESYTDLMVFLARTYGRPW